MKIGTKSLLFGVHQFIWHPICVARAWRLLYQEWPSARVWLAIILHDVGYWGCSDMDGPSGVEHPRKGAELVAEIVAAATHDPARALNAFRFTAYHSKTYARSLGVGVSPLYYADKVAVLMEPVWFYLLRAWLSGEGKEFVERSPMKGRGLRLWFKWYRGYVAHKHLGGGMKGLPETDPEEILY